MFEKALAARGFEPPWGKRKVPAFVSKAGAYYGASGGGRTRTPRGHKILSLGCLPVQTHSRTAALYHIRGDFVKGKAGRKLKFGRKSA